MPGSTVDRLFGLKIDSVNGKNFIVATVEQPGGPGVAIVLLLCCRNPIYRIDPKIPGEIPIRLIERYSIQHYPISNSAAIHLLLYSLTVTPADREAICSTIDRQLAAFQRDDAAEAFSFASPGIQAQFATPEKFMRMVRASYPSVYRPRAVVFQDMTQVEGLPAQKLMLMSPEGKLVMALYLMQQQPNGNWRIHGCVLLPMEE